MNVLRIVICCDQYQSSVVAVYSCLCAISFSIMLNIASVIVNAQNCAYCASIMLMFLATYYAKIYADIIGTCLKRTYYPNTVWKCNMFGRYFTIYQNQIPLSTTACVCMYVKRIFAWTNASKIRTYVLQVYGEN